MARIAGVDLPNEKRLEIGLTYIKGIGRVTSNKILKETKAVLAAGRPNRAQTGGLPHKRGGHNIASKKPAQLRLQRRGTLFEQGSCTTRHSFLKK